jgi:23S rRNA (uridine2552-2'-O)-methyltransferase
MARSKSSKQWLKEHFSDVFVKKAQEEGYRSRAVYKLMEIQKRDQLIKSGMTVIDLGAAPGSWSQLIRDWVGEKGKIIALDILPMDPLGNVEFIQGDFREPEVFEKLLKVVQELKNSLPQGGEGKMSIDIKVDIVVSDMAPNSSGMNSVDQPRAMLLSELSLELAKKILKREGSLIVKTFQGEGYDYFLKELRLFFKKVVIRKPEASRDRSRENYLVATGFMI